MFGELQGLFSRLMGTSRQSLALFHLNKRVGCGKKWQMVWPMMALLYQIKLRHKLKQKIKYRNALKRVASSYASFKQLNKSNQAVWTNYSQALSKTSPKRSFVSIFRHHPKDGVPECWNRSRKGEEEEDEEEDEEEVEDKAR